MTGLLLLGGAGVGGAGVGDALRRRSGWSADAFRGLLALAMLPWFVQHLGLARLMRSGALNPLRGDVALVPSDLLAPALVAAGIGGVLLRPRRLRLLGAMLPALAAVITWWITVPLYREASLRGWVFLPPSLASDLLLAWHLGMACVLAAYRPDPGV